MNVVECQHLEAAGLPGLFHRHKALAHAAIHLAEANELHAVVMGVAGTLHRCAEATDDADHDALRSDHVGNFVGAAEAVLDGQDGCRRFGDLESQGGCGSHTVVLGRDDDQIAVSDDTAVHDRFQLHCSVAAGAFDAQALGIDRIDMGGPCIDGDDVVPALIGEQRRIDGAHGANADDCDFHVGVPVNRFVAHRRLIDARINTFAFQNPSQ